jgi:U3 small nucleolar ribonucleoprotein protein IMP4
MLRRLNRERKEYLLRKRSEAVSGLKEESVSTVYPPKVLITTSREPSNRLLRFAKELKWTIPNSKRINRGNMVIKDLASICKAHKISDLAIVFEHRGTPDGILFSRFPNGPTLACSLHNVVLRHDIPDVSAKTLSEAYPNLVFHNFQSDLGSKITSHLKTLFPVPNESSKKIIGFMNTDDYISFRQYAHHAEKGQVVLSEQGPRFEMRPFELKPGSLDAVDVDPEWNLKTFFKNSARKRHL